MTVSVISSVTLDGVVQAPRPDEDTRERGAAAVPRGVTVHQADADKRQALHDGVIATYQLVRP